MYYHYTNPAQSKNADQYCMLTRGKSQIILPFVAALLWVNPAAAQTYGWAVGTPSWASPDGAVSARLGVGQSATVIAQGLPQLPEPWRAMGAAVRLEAPQPISSITLKPSFGAAGYTAVLALLEDGSWVEVPSSLGGDGSRTVSKPGTATLALASRADQQQGVASWYRYRGCPCAASTRYPKGSKLKVTRADDPTRSVVVTVNDYGPEAWTGRAIDLDLVAFEKLGSRRAGLLTVTVVPL